MSKIIFKGVEYASSDNTWIGTKAEYELQKNEIPDGYTVILTDDVATGTQVVVDEVRDGDMNPVTSNAVYDILQNITPINSVTDGSSRAVTSNAVYDALNVCSTVSVHCPSGSNTTTNGGANEIGSYTIPNDGVYAIHWTCYVANETVGGTAMGTRVIQNNNTIAEQSLFQGIQTWSNAIFVSSVFKAKKNDVIKVYTISANPISWLESDVYIVRII